VDRRTTPLGAALSRIGVTADQLTMTGLVMAAAAAVAVGSGHLWVGLLLLIASGLPDLLDGPVAKASGTAAPRGAFFDSVADRVTDSLLLGGVAWYLASTHGGRAALLPFAVLGAAFLVSYERAKAESLGFNGKGGIMERAERLVLLGLGLLVSSLLVPVLWVMLVLTLATAVQRFVMVWRQAGSVQRAEAGEEGAAQGLAADPGSESRWRAGRVESRWRTWRETTALRSGPERRAPGGRWRDRRQRVLSSRSTRAGQARRSRRRVISGP
jgi:CDP-diacylglycerol--glycerol-3-phosphate 3-phosphatidyltransferase